ncbi:EAL domain-containing protein [Aquabacterium sp.]|uniref:EAL domain-containing protein n=1 Tax=Aquabacterium sp. TaxID=1872578 RepID=UPI002C23672F|nr:EAL domain-containing protein [Aquabacterium sp.]HSW08645.1 EAL domain-containing protein [Aquabacterium sp.]
MKQLFTRFLGRLSVSRKLMLIYLLDLSAVIFISGILINEKFIAIDFARKELAGNAYVGEVRQGLMVLARDGDAQLLPGANPLADRLQRAEQQHGAGMNSSDTSVALQAALLALAASPLGGPTTSSSHALALRQQAFERARALVTRIGNQSNLILDPDLDSYYTMSIVLLRYPELLELVAQIGHELQQQAQGPQPPGNDARTRYLVLEGRLVATARGIESDHAEAFAAAADAQLRHALQPGQARLLAGIERFRSTSRLLLDSAGGAPGLPALHADQQALFGALDGAWQSSAAQLDRLIDVRIGGFFTRMWLHMGTALFLLLLILTAVYFVARLIALPLRRLSDVADTVRRTGDHSLRAQWNSHDEIGRLVDGFNSMLAQLDHERGIQQELAATARAAQAQQNLVEATPIPMVVTAVPGHEVLHANGPAAAWLNGRRSDPWAVGLEAPVRARFFQELADREAVNQFEVHWRGGAEPAWAVLSARRLVYQGQDAVLTAFAPISDLKTLEQRLELWAKVFEASSEGILILDARHRVLTANRALCRHTGFELAELIGETLAPLFDEEASSAVLAQIWAAADKRGSWQGEVRLKRRSDSTYPAWLVVSAVRDGPGSVSHYICTALDISDRKASEERIHFLAHHDALTGLPNRLLFTERLRQATQQARRSGHQVAVLFIDLDRFKTINDSLGHHAGDALLRSVAKRLQEAVRDGDTVCRLGGDEFVIALSGVNGSDEVLGIVERRLVPMIRRVHQVGSAELHVSCSIGVALFPDDSRDIDELMQHADVAMYQAKAMGRDSAQFFTPELNERAHKRLRLESQLRHAIDRGEMALHYQPRVAAQSGTLVGVEALLRWSSPELGEVSPVEFIPIAEESRLIMGIGAWVITEACRQHALWKDQGLGEVAVSINLSAVQLRDPDLVEVLRQAIARYGVNPAALELELTESTLMETVKDTLGQLHALKRLGVSLSVDDFGTGYSSLNYLNRFPIDRLKIDRSFVRDLLADATDLAITRAIIGLGHTLGLRVVAEGVESEAVAGALRAAHCDELQGYHFARPLPPAELVAWLLSNRQAPRKEAHDTQNATG